MTSRYYFNTNVTGHTIRIPCRIKRIRHDGDPKATFPTGLYLVDIEVLEDGFDYKEDQKLTYGGQSIKSLDEHRSVHELVKRGELYVGDY